uniref:Uncharacterized protein n=1 Tax=Timema cristinae TaxID=61476 RepID=A0A7R9GRX5_TIMCR|nr:unnamed protein product [Timema cristinae]
MPSERSMLTRVKAASGSKKILDMVPTLDNAVSSVSLHQDVHFSTDDHEVVLKSIQSFLGKDEVSRAEILSALNQPTKLNVYKNDTDSWDYTTPAIGVVKKLFMWLKKKSVFNASLSLHTPFDLPTSIHRGSPKIPWAALERGLARLRAHLPNFAARNTPAGVR